MLDNHSQIYCLGYVVQVISLMQAQQNVETGCEQVWQNQELCLIAWNTHAVILLS